MIEWIPYDRNSREIESHRHHLITNGVSVWVALHAKYIKRDGYGWHDGLTPLNYHVTHWAKLNLPEG